jgi:hypothetical protein
MTDYVFAGRVGRLNSRSSDEVRTVARTSGEGDLLVDSGYRERNYAGDVWSFSVAAVTVPVNANNLVSVCGIYNPPGSGKMIEIIDTTVGIALATTVVQEFVWVSSTAAASALATFTTLGTARSRVLQRSTSSDARVYTAVTHSGTPDVEAKIGSFAKVTSDQTIPTRVFNGTLLIPAGILASIATLTAASTASGINLSFTYAVLPD